MSPTVWTIATLLLLSQSARAGTVYVDANLTTGLNDGSSWENAFQGPVGLRIALVTTSTTERIFVAQGRYVPALNGNRLTTLSVNSREVYGGFLGGETSVEERPPIGTAPSVLSGDQFDNDTQPGAGAFDDNSFHVVTIGSSFSPALLDGFTIEGGYADHLAIPEDCSGCGAGLFSRFKDFVVRNTTFRKNQTTSGGYGAGAFVIGGEVQFVDCVFEDNAALFGGGLLLQNVTGASVLRCVFRRNSGCAIRTLAQNPDLMISECQIYDNTGSTAAVYLTHNATPHVRNCTIVGNHATGTLVAGLRVELDNTPVVGNCILWGNVGTSMGVPTGGSAAQISGALGHFNLVEGGLTGPGHIGNLDATPDFVDLASFDLALAAGSPGADAGDNALVLAGTTVDAAGAPRFADDLCAQDSGAGSSPIVDMGAFEVQSAVGPTFCDAQDGSLIACPCTNPGAPSTGCDLQQGTGGVRLDLLSQQASPSNRATLQGAGFPASSAPTALVLRARGLDAGAPVAFGDGLRCVGTPLVRLAGTSAMGGLSTHVFGHGAVDGLWFYQLWFRNTPAAYCTPEAFNLSSGRVLCW